MSEISKRLGTTEAGLKVLFRLKRGEEISGGTAGERLERDGMVTAGGWFQPNVYTSRRLTERGLQVCEQARKLGY
jgi:hypothetical protein